MEYSDEVLRQAAQVAHEANRAYCKNIGDNSQPPFGEAPYWQVISAINGIRHHWNNPELTPEASHQNWVYEKELTGWKWGPVKDEVKREHPCMVPFSHLPREQQVKDYLFSAIARVLRPCDDGT